MRNKEQKGDLSVHAMAAPHVVLPGMDLPEQTGPRFLEFALRRAGVTESDKHCLPGYKIFSGAQRLHTSGVALFDPKTGIRSDTTFPNFLKAQCTW
jgi:hypothetical protein